MHIYIQYKAIYFTIRCENKGGVLFIKFLVAILFYNFNASSNLFYNFNASSKRAKSSDFEP